MLAGWHQSGSCRYELYFRINRFVGEVGEHEVRRIYRNAIGDWCAEIVVADRVRVEVFDYQPTPALMRALKVSGTDLAGDITTATRRGGKRRATACQASRRLVRCADRHGPEDQTFTGSSQSDLDDKVRRWRQRNPSYKIVGIETGEYLPDGLQRPPKFRSGHTVARRVYYEVLED